MKKYPARYLSNQEKEYIVKRIGKGEKISRIANEINISRTTLYKWLKIKSFGVKELRRKKISIGKRRKVIELALKYPNYSIRQISSLSGLSLGFVWSIMKKHLLNTKEKRLAHFLDKGTSLYKNISDNEKLTMIESYRAGEQATRICSEHGISRTIFYRWIHKCRISGDKYVVLKGERPKGRVHWRFIEGMEGMVRDLVASNPELSLSQLHNRIKLKRENIISRSGLYYVCKRLELTTYEKRLIYAKSGGAVGVVELGMPDYVNRRYIRNDISLFIQIVFLSISSLVIGFWVLVIGQGLIQHEPAEKVEINSLRTGKQVYEARQESEEIVYVVKAGDSLWHISEEIYESGYNWVDIASINKLPNPDLIDIGQRLIIPAVAAKEATLAVWQ